MPTLTARPEGRNERHARIGVFQNGGKAGVLTVEAKYEAEVVGLINGASALLDRCEQMRQFIAAIGPTLTEPALALRAEQLQTTARAAIAQAEGRS